MAKINLKYSRRLDALVLKPGKRDTVSYRLVSRLASVHSPVLLGIARDESASEDAPFYYGVAGLARLDAFLSRPLSLVQFRCLLESLCDVMELCVDKGLPQGNVCFDPACVFADVRGAMRFAFVPYERVDGAGSALELLAHLSRRRVRMVLPQDEAVRDGVADFARSVSVLSAADFTAFLETRFGACGDAEALCMRGDGRAPGDGAALDVDAGKPCMRENGGASGGRATRTCAHGDGGVQGGGSALAAGAGEPFARAEGASGGVVALAAGAEGPCLSGDGGAVGSGDAPGAGSERPCMQDDDGASGACTEGPYTQGAHVMVARDAAVVGPCARDEDGANGDGGAPGAGSAPGAGAALGAGAEASRAWRGGAGTPRMQGVQGSGAPTRPALSVDPVALMTGRASERVVARSVVDDLASLPHSGSLVHVPETSELSRGRCEGRCEGDAAPCSDPSSERPAPQPVPQREDGAVLRSASRPERSASQSAPQCEGAQTGGGAQTACAALHPERSASQPTVRGRGDPDHPAMPAARFALERVSDGVRYALAEGPVVIGRSRTCDISIAGNGALSRRHARVDAAAGTIEDLGSANGTFIDGMRLSAHRPVPLVVGAPFMLANEEFRLRAD